MIFADPAAPEERRFRSRFLIATIVLAVLIGLVFTLWPALDIEISRPLRLCPSAKFAAPWCTADHATQLIRRVFVITSVVISVVVVLGTLYSIWRYRGLVGMAQARWLFVMAALAIGPGLVSNVILKDNWGRARPRQIVEFGGHKTFTPPLLPAKECVRNCAFVSGEASSAIVPFFALAFLLPRWRKSLLVGGVLWGLAAGLVRISQGGHFLSDVLFAGIFMALTVSLLHALIIGNGDNRYGARLLRSLEARIRALVSRVAGPRGPSKPPETPPRPPGLPA